MAQCKAKTRLGAQCKNEAVRELLCAVHFGIEKAKPSWWKRHREAIKSSTEAAAGTAALLELIKAAIELWKSLPLGPAPAVPPAFRRLESELLPGPRYPRMLRVHIPFNKSHEAMAWSELLSIYDQAKKMGDEKSVEMLAEEFESWVNQRPEAYQSLLNVFLDEEVE